MIVRDARLLLLFPVVDVDLVLAEEERVFAGLVATSTVRFTGRDRVALLLDELLAVDLDGVAVLEVVDLLD